MILINVKWHIKEEFAEQWLELTKAFTEATRLEDGNLFFEWSRSTDDPNTYVLIEGFKDANAGSQHTSSDHFKEAIEELPTYVSTSPEIIYIDTPDTNGWGPMGEIQPR